MAHFNQGLAYGNILLVVEEYCTGLSLGGRFHDGAYGLSLGGDWAVRSGSMTDRERGGGCRSDSNGPQNDCML